MFELVNDPRYLAEGFKPQASRWYCLHCIDPRPISSSMGWVTSSGVKEHLKVNHELTPKFEPGVDYCQGGTLRVFLLRKRQRDIEEMEIFRLHMESCITSDDFLFETRNAPAREKYAA